MTILYQFTRVTNCYYVLNALFQTIPSVAIMKPWASVIPLSIIIAVGVLKEAAVEIRRWLQDRKVNNTPTRRLLADGTIQEISLSQVRVGDILIIRDDETVPADCVLLRTKKHCNGTCWVETSNLDGEKNLKPKLSSKYIEKHFREIFLNRTIDFIGRFIEPSKDMYFYDGLITLQFSKTVTKKVEINLNTFLHRGAVLRNSGEVLALVTQTGVQTKVLMNLGSYKAKISRLEKTLNFFMMFNVLLMLTLALTLTYRNF